MAAAEPIQVTGPGGLHRTIGTADWPLDASRAEVLIERGAGGERRELPLVPPVIQETLDVDTRPVETGRVRIRKVVHQREELVDPPLRRDAVVVERAPINRVVDRPIPVRSEGIRW